MGQVLLSRLKISAEINFNLYLAVVGVVYSYSSRHHNIDLGRINEVAQPGY